jgi:hypothetical protein
MRRILGTALTTSAAVALALAPNPPAASADEGDQAAAGLT